MLSALPAYVVTAYVHLHLHVCVCVLSGLRAERSNSASSATVPQPKQRFAKNPTVSTATTILHALVTGVQSINRLDLIRLSKETFDTGEAACCLVQGFVDDCFKHPMLFKSMKVASGKLVLLPLSSFPSWQNRLATHNTVALPRTTRFSGHALAVRALLFQLLGATGVVIFNDAAEHPSTFFGNIAQSLAHRPLFSHLRIPIGLSAADLRPPFFLKPSDRPMFATCSIGTSESPLQLDELGGHDIDEDDDDDDDSVTTGSANAAVGHQSPVRDPEAVKVSRVRAQLQVRRL